MVMRLVLNFFFGVLVKVYYALSLEKHMELFFCNFIGFL